MSKVIEWEVVCPECGLVQAYHSHRKQVKGTRTKNCNRCKHGFACKKRRLTNLPDVKKRLREEKKEKGTGFHKYSKSS